MLTVDNLHVGYNPGLHILRGVNIIAPPGRATAVLGANGVGKSTLLKAVFGMLKPTQGRILLDITETRTKREPPNGACVNVVPVAELSLLPRPALRGDLPEILAPTALVKLPVT